MSDQLFRILVSDARTMSFLPAPKSEDTEDELNEAQFLFEQPPDDAGVADRHTDDKLQTPYTDTILQRRLLNTFYAARTHIEERGVSQAWVYDTFVAVSEHSLQDGDLTDVLRGNAVLLEEVREFPIGIQHEGVLVGPIDFAVVK